MEIVIRGYWGLIEGFRECPCIEWRPSHRLLMRDSWKPENGSPGAVILKPFDGKGWKRLYEKGKPQKRGRFKRNGTLEIEIVPVKTNMYECPFMIKFLKTGKKIKELLIAGYFRFDFP